MGNAPALSARQLVELRDLLELDRTALETELDTANARDAEASDSLFDRLDRVYVRRQPARVRRRQERIALGLNQIRAALWRMSAGQYGSCLVCDAGIGFARLRSKPEATLCQTCQLSGYERRPPRRLAHET